MCLQSNDEHLHDVEAMLDKASEYLMAINPSTGWAESVAQVAQARLQLVTTRMALPALESANRAQIAAVEALEKDSER